MVKPLGNLLANKKTNDKISGKTQARFASKALLVPSDSAGKPAAASAEKTTRPVRFKKRKR